MSARKGAAPVISKKASNPNKLSKVGGGGGGGGGKGGKKNNSNEKEDEMKMKKLLDSLPTEAPTKKSEPARKITDLKNPTDITVDAERAREMGFISGTTRESFESTKKKRTEKIDHQHAIINKLLPLRENQTKNTLSIYGIHGRLADSNLTDATSINSIHDDDHHHDDGDDERGDDIHQYLRDVNMVLYHERETKQFPLEKLVTRGLLTARVPTIHDRQYSTAIQLTEDSACLKGQLEQLTRTRNTLHDNDNSGILPVQGSGGRSNKKTAINRSINRNSTGGGGGGGDPSSVTVNLSILCGNLEADFGYKRASSTPQKNHIFRQFDEDEGRRRREFFQSDPLEDETPFGALPSSYKMFTLEREKNKEKYEKRDESVRLQSSMVGKSNLEFIDRDYFLHYRRKPRIGECLCLNGTNCLFYTFCNDPDLRYVGRVFYTPNQEKLVERGELQREGLCIDCLLRKWTLIVEESKEKSISQKTTLNHFTVLVGVGQYSKKCMLEVEFNRLYTGIVGCVPKYSENYRDKGVCQFRDPLKQSLIQEVYITENCLDKGNTCLGFVKSRPLVRSHLAEESVRSSLFLSSSPSRGGGKEWIKVLQQSFNQSLLLDRHYLSELEKNVCIGSLEETSPFYSSPSSHLLILAQRFQHQKLDQRELPVSLLRLFFAGQNHFSEILTKLSFTSFRFLASLFQIKTREELRSPLSLVLDNALCSFEQSLLFFNMEENYPLYDCGLTSILLEKDKPLESFWCNFPLSKDFVLALEEERACENFHILYVVLWRIHISLLMDNIIEPWHNTETESWFLYRTKLYRDTHLDLLSMVVKDNLESDTVLVPLLRHYYPTCNRVCCVEELPDLSGYASDNFKTGPHLKERTTLPEKIGHYSCIKTFNNICKDRNWWEIIKTYGEQHPIIYDHVKLSLKCVMLGNLPNSLGSLSLIARIRINISFFPQYADQILTREEIDSLMLPNSNPYLLAEQKRKKKLLKEQTKKQSPEMLARAMRIFDNKEAQKMNYDKTVFKMLLLVRCRYFASSLMKEVLFYTMEASGLMDQYLSVDQKWIQYKEIIRLANGQCRQEISRQASSRPLSERLDWLVIEHIEKSTDNKYDLKRGRIMHFHTVALKVAKKVMKRDFMGIWEVKSTAIEEKINLEKFGTIERIYCDNDQFPQTKMYEDDLHFLSYRMAMNETPIFQSSLFQAMGMSREGIEILRDLLMKYYNYSMPDDSLKKKIKAFIYNSISNYILAKTVFKAITHYKKSELILHLPIQYGLSHIHALRRRQLRIADEDPTPEKLGVFYQCHGCQKFANTIIQPQDYPSYSNYSELNHSRFQVFTHYPKKQNIVLTSDSKNARTMEYHSLMVASTSNMNTSSNGSNSNQSALNDENAPKPTTKKKKKKGKAINNHNSAATTTTGGEEGSKKQGGGREDEEEKKIDNISFLNIAAYNINDGKAYCVRNKRNGVSSRNVLKKGESRVTETAVVMRTRNSRIKVICHRTFIVEDSVNQTNIRATTQDTLSSTDEYGDEEDDGDEDDDDDGEEMDDEEEDSDIERGDDDSTNRRKRGGGGGGRKRRKRHERITEPIIELLTGNLTELNRENYDRMEQYVKSRTRNHGRISSNVNNAMAAATTTVAKENNKKKILNIVMEPLHKLYNCNVPMREIDMISIVKNGKVLCVECGMMTEYKNHSMTPYGPTCMTHPIASMMEHHPAWQNHLSLQNGTSMLSILHQARHHDDNGVNTLSNGNNFGGGGGEKNAKKKSVHQKHLLAKHQRAQQCRLCRLLHVSHILVYSLDNFALREIHLCLVCHHNLTRARPNKPLLNTLTDLRNYQIAKGYRPL